MLEPTFERMAGLLAASFSPEIPLPDAETIVSQAFQQILQRGHTWSFLRQEGYWALPAKLEIECVLTQYSSTVSFSAPFQEEEIFDQPRRLEFLSACQLWDGEKWYEIYKFEPSTGITLIGNYLGSTKTVKCTLAMPVVDSPFSDNGLKLPKVKEFISIGEGNHRVHKMPLSWLKAHDPAFSAFGTPNRITTITSANYSQVLKRANSGSAYRLGETRFRLWPTWDGDTDLIIPVSYIAADWKFGGISGVLVNDGATAENSGDSDLQEESPQFDPAFNMLDTLPYAISEDFLLSTARILGVQYCISRTATIAAYKGVDWRSLLSTYNTQAETAYDACRTKDRALWATDPMHTNL